MKALYICNLLEVSAFLRFKNIFKALEEIQNFDEISRRIKFMYSLFVNMYIFFIYS